MMGFELDKLVLGYGVFAFTLEQLNRWRERVATPAGDNLQGTLERTDLRIDETQLKRVPAPYASDHPAAHLLRRKGLAAFVLPSQENDSCEKLGLYFRFSIVWINAASSKCPTGSILRSPPACPQNVPQSLADRRATWI
ncbi:DUF2461 family protein [Hyphomonas sp. KY3]|uniref:DUF2461 family protein n=1 Tax=Hyphomonas sp. KY3 TaxID=2016196 RepID=UPI001A8D7EAF